ncbi:MAG: hypothetical protein ABTQ34_06220 [Bdellovibrionales bacterium]
MFSFKYPHKSAVKAVLKGIGWNDLDYEDYYETDEKIQDEMIGADIAQHFAVAGAAMTKTSNNRIRASVEYIGIGSYRISFRDTQDDQSSIVVTMGAINTEFGSVPTVHLKAPFQVNAPWYGCLTHYGDFNHDIRAIAGHFSKNGCFPSTPPTPPRNSAFSGWVMP